MDALKQQTIDKQTEINNELLSLQGYLITGYNESGNLLTQQEVRTMNSRIAILKNNKLKSEIELKNITLDQENNLQLERVKLLKTTQEQERALALIELDKKFNEELKANQGNEIALLKLRTDYSLQRYNIEQTYILKSKSQITSIYNSLATSLMQGISNIDFSFGDQQEQARQEINKNISAIHKEENELIKSYKKREISQTAYLAKKSELNEKMLAEEQKLTFKTSDYWDRVNTSIAKSFADLTATFKQNLDMQLTAFKTNLQLRDIANTEMINKQMSMGISLATGNIEQYSKDVTAYSNAAKSKEQATSQVYKIMTQMALSTLSMVASSWGTMLAQGQVNTGKLLVLALDGLS